MFSKPRRVTTAITAVTLTLMLAALSGCDYLKDDKSRVSDPKKQAFRKWKRAIISTATAPPP